MSSIAELGTPARMEQDYLEARKAVHTAPSHAWATAFADLSHKIADEADAAGFRLDEVTLDTRARETVWGELTTGVAS